jgi:hypothetical protein
MFGVMGDGNLFMVDSWVRDGGGAYVRAANEGGAVLMAQGFACAPGRPGTATVTHGRSATQSPHWRTAPNLPSEFMWLDVEYRHACHHTVERRRQPRP